MGSYCIDLCVFWCKVLWWTDEHKLVIVPMRSTEEFQSLLWSSV
jgi:hypothetical protein